MGIPGQITEITDAQELRGIVDVAGARREIQLNYIVSDGRPVESCVGDWVLVHVGFAMSRIDEREAEATLRLLSELGEMQLEMEAMQAAQGDSEP